MSSFEASSPLRIQLLYVRDWIFIQLREVVYHLLKIPTKAHWAVMLHNQCCSFHKLHWFDDSFTFQFPDFSHYFFHKAIGTGLALLNHRINCWPGSKVALVPFIVPRSSWKALGYFSRTPLRHAFSNREMLSQSRWIFLNHWLQSVVTTASALQRRVEPKLLPQSVMVPWVCSQSGQDLLQTQGLQSTVNLV